MTANRIKQVMILFTTYGLKCMGLVLFVTGFDIICTLYLDFVHTTTSFSSVLALEDLKPISMIQINPSVKFIGLCMSDLTLSLPRSLPLTSKIVWH